MCCGDLKQESIKDKLENILGTLKTLRKICRVIALMDAIFGLMFLIILITRRLIKAADHPQPYSVADLVKIALLCVLGLQMVFALMLYEGARRGVLCLIKAWLVFTLGRIVITLSVLTTLTARGNKEISFSFGLEIAVSAFQLVEAIFILAFHKQAKKAEKVRANELPVRDNYWMDMDDLKDIRCTYYPSAAVTPEIMCTEPNSDPKENSRDTAVYV